MSKTFNFTAKIKKTEERAFVSIGDTALCVSGSGDKARFWLHQVTKRDEDGNVIESRPLFIVPVVDSQWAKNYGGTNRAVLHEIGREALASLQGVSASAVAGSEGTFEDKPPV